jgi:hypothetical protein
LTAGIDRFSENDRAQNKKLNFDPIQSKVTHIIRRVMLRMAAILAAHGVTLTGTAGQAIKLFSWDSRVYDWRDYAIHMIFVAQ